jgi:26S proteasome regulatory subunit (ATPase 3-interacting protein)
MNRPFGAVDVAANLKGTVPKTATQKILVALAEKGELTQKIYGESNYPVVRATRSRTRCF